MCMNVSDLGSILPGFRPQEPRRDMIDTLGHPALEGGSKLKLVSSVQSGVSECAGHGTLVLDTLNSGTWIRDKDPTTTETPKFAQCRRPWRKAIRS